MCVLPIRIISSVATHKLNNIDPIAAAAHAAIVTTTQ